MTFDAAARAEIAPPLLGREYLDATFVTALWGRLGSRLSTLVAAPGVTLESWLHERHEVWAVVGRVCFHLAENKADPARPFAFLATYSTGLTAAAKVAHRPLGQALQDSVATKDHDALLRLLEPVQRAAGQSEFVRELVETNAIFRPQPWTAAQAHRFLRDVPALEAAGVVVRVPDWWKPAAPPRVTVQVSLGGSGAPALGAVGLLEFNVGFALEGDPLTPEEWEQLKEAGAGLVPLRGRWVEIDRARLDEVLNAWKRAQKAARDGIPFHEAMRLLAGAGRLPGAVTDNPPGREWSRITAGPWLAGVLSRLRSPGTDRASLPGKSLEATLRPYQEDGVRWLVFLNELGLGACLADDMGLGKTIQVLSLLLVLKARGTPSRPHLIVVPASLLGNWRSEAARFAPALRLRLAHASGDGVEAAVAEDADIVVTTYGTLAKTEWIRAAAWDTVVLDEAQAIKNPGARQTRAVKMIEARVRLALTGTPVENRAGDLWSLFDFLQPGLLGSAAEFRKLVTAASGSTGGWAPLRALVSPYILRRLKTDRGVAPDLPAKTEQNAECGLTREQAALYQRAVDELRAKLESTAGIGRRGAVLQSLMRLKQICNHPSHWLGDGGWETDRSGKLQRLEELVEPIVQRQEKMLLFTQFREAVDPLAATLATLFGRPGLVLHGGTTVGKRKALVDRFQADDALPFLVLSLKAGGTGLNLTAATHVVHFDRWWNPAVEDQATDRAFRIGQQRAVFVHKLVSRGTVEERVDEMIRAKRGLAKELLSGGEDEVRLTELSDEELLKTVSLDITRARVES
jgi:non-specific serine/threonine protein kinase